MHRFYSDGFYHYRIIEESIRPGYYVMSMIGVFEESVSLRRDNIASSRVEEELSQISQETFDAAVKKAQDKFMSLL